MSAPLNDAIIRLLAALETSTGLTFLERFVAEIAQQFETDAAVIARIDPNDPGRLITVAFYHNGSIVGNSEARLDSSPAAEILASATACIFRSRMQERFPADPLIACTGANCYVGVPLFTGDGAVTGLVALLDRLQINDDQLAVELLQLFGDRLVAEIGRERPAALQAQLESHLGRCRSDLETTRGELEALSHAVSHDLRGPLRAINGFSEILLSDYRDKLDETANDYLHRIRSNAMQMDALLQALLLLSRVTRHRLRLSPVDLSRLCTNRLARLQQRDPQRRILIDIQEDLHACCDPELMTIALDLLLDNAWRYSADSDPARIGFSAGYRDDMTEFRLTDNGTGFDMAYVDKLFELFQCLHGQQTPVGVGAGLATVKRIIERHGGSIRGEAVQGAGASFYFTLPTTPEAACAAPAEPSSTLS
jgi:signal transduction histidine kinase